MSITTRTGDAGRTRLYSGQEVSKSDLSPHAVGALDEGMSVLGIARSLCADAEMSHLILEIQQETFTVGAELATHPDNRSTLKHTVDDEMLGRLDSLRDDLESRTPMPTDFIVPGGNTLAAHLDHARTVFRRCERSAVALQESGFLTNPNVIKWLNRVSDFLWLLGRNVEGQEVTGRRKPV